MNGPHEVRVWAPRADRVDLVREGEPAEMSPTEGGWWRTVVDDWRPGTDYAFLLDGEGPFPDPRSRWQPEGVHGPSRVVDPADFEWHHDSFRAPPLASAVFYELHVGTFTPEGTFAAATEHLDHLLALGVTHVELLPVAQYPGEHGWGYDGVDLYAVHQPYGGPDGLRRFVDACHGAGLAVVLDVVYNHLGPDGNYLGRFGPYFTDTYGTPWGEAVNLDGEGSDEVRRFLIDNARMWLEDYRIDGLRIDAVHALFDRSAVHFLEELGEAVRGLEARTGRPLVLVAESDLNDPRMVNSPEAGGYGMDAQWSDDFHHALHALLTGEERGYYADFGSLSHLAAALERGFVYDGRHSPYRGRRHGRPFRHPRGRKLLGYLQNHDQVGNRALGERITALTGADRVRMGAALVLTAPFVPLLFQGEEWGASTPFLYFTDHGDPELGRAVSRGRRREFAAFGWGPDEVPDPQDPGTFLRSVLRWDEVEREPHAGLLEWYRRLVRLRRDHPSLADDRMPVVRVDPEAGWLVMERGSVRVAVHPGEGTVRVPVRGGGEDPPGPVDLLLSHGGVSVREGVVELPPDSVAVLDTGGPPVSRAP